MTKKDAAKQIRVAMSLHEGHFRGFISTCELAFDLVCRYINANKVQVYGVTTPYEAAVRIRYELASGPAKQIDLIAKRFTTLTEQEFKIKGKPAIYRSTGEKEWYEYRIGDIARSKMYSGSDILESQYMSRVRFEGESKSISELKKELLKILG